MNNINFIKPEKNKFFYSTEEIDYIKEKINIGLRGTTIAKMFVIKFGRSQVSVLNKVNYIKRSMGVSKPRKQSTEIKKEPTTITLPEGFTFSGKCKKVEISENYFKVYF